MTPTPCYKQQKIFNQNCHGLFENKTQPCNERKVNQILTIRQIAWRDGNDSTNCEVARSSLFDFYPSSPFPTPFGSISHHDPPIDNSKRPCFLQDQNIHFIPQSPRLRRKIRQSWVALLAFHEPAVAITGFEFPRFIYSRFSHSRCHLPLLFLVSHPSITFLTPGNFIPFLPQIRTIKLKPPFEMHLGWDKKNDSSKVFISSLFSIFLLEAKWRGGDAILFRIRIAIECHRSLSLVVCRYVNGVGSRDMSL